MLPLANGACMPCCCHTGSLAVHSRTHRFVAFVFVCAFVLINLYVGVIFSQFTRIRLVSTTGSAFLTNDQQEWAELSKMVFK